MIYFFDGGAGGGPHITAQRWRIYITANNGHTNTSITEFEWLDSGGSPISTAGGTATASSEFSGAFPASAAFDGVVGGSNRWATTSVGVTPCWLEMSFAAPVTPYAMKIWGSVTGTTNDVPKDFIAEYFDGSIWVQQGASVTNQTGWVANVPRTFNI